MNSQKIRAAIRKTLMDLKNMHIDELERKLYAAELDPLYDVITEMFEGGTKYIEEREKGKGVIAIIINDVRYVRERLCTGRKKGLQKKQRKLRKSNHTWRKRDEMDREKT